MNVTEKLPKKQCMGCGVCSQLCPAKCIAMRVDSEGFLYPSVDKSKCVDCNLCVKKCPILSDTVIFSNSNETKYYAAIIKDQEELKLSSSGGVFSTLADHILHEGGYVCGCVYNDRMEAVHVVSKDQNTIRRMYGSKYVQSNILECYSVINEILLRGEKVLFTGTACQVAALKAFLGKEYEGLYTVDILCHGVPSPGLFRLFVEHLSKKEESQVLDIRFRDKEKNGWGSEHRTSVTYANGKKKWPFMPAYFSAFFYGLDLRESCYCCKYAGTKRVSDLTIGDYWGSWKKYGKRFREGISVVSVNSKRGELLFNSISRSLLKKDELSIGEAVWSNDNFDHPVKRPMERDDFYTRIDNYRSILKKTYTARTYRKKIIISLYGVLLPEKVRLSIHKILKK